ncbi:hypothetical protein [Pelomonas cellulosilytica]|uniref:Uncharacterized protein n=1 Tax=Pelomonas cellulosilytica TaxID=2906762 RepID=A0ABS8XYM7_9BURK|nr:hypothetical protein [Pelomonas sp. P8]MCE4554460.1 hypothetical protein [Pelomonas sp. P8]
MNGWFTRSLQKRAALAVAASLALPWLAGEFAKGFYQPGLADDAVRRQMLIDFIVIGASLFALTMVATWLIGCWITAVMKGPRRDADAFPGAPGEPPP